MFAIALVSSLALHAVLFSIRDIPIQHSKSVAKSSSIVLVDAWNIRLLNSTASSIPAVEDNHHSNSNTPLQPVVTKLNSQEREYTSEQSQSGIKFYLFDEVDTPAKPIDDWNISQDNSSYTGVLQSAVLRIWILESGEIQDVSILRTIPENLDTWQKISLANSIKNTRTRPAFRDGMPVASERTIEMVFDTGLKRGEPSGAAQF